MNESGRGDEFPITPARRAVVSVVRGYGVVQRLMVPYFAQFGLTPPQFQMLTVVNGLKGKPITQRLLAHELYVSFPNITVMLARLEEAGLVRRRLNPNDGREKLVELTRKAGSLLRRIWKEHPRQLEYAASGLDDRERLQLAHLVDKMIAAHAATVAASSTTSTTSTKATRTDRHKIE